MCWGCTHIGRKWPEPWLRVIKVMHLLQVTQPFQHLREMLPNFKIGISSGPHKVLITTLINTHQHLVIGSLEKDHTLGYITICHSPLTSGLQRDMNSSPVFVWIIHSPKQQELTTLLTINTNMGCATLLEQFGRDGLWSDTHIHNNNKRGTLRKIDPNGLLLHM